MTVQYVDSVLPANLHSLCGEQARWVSGKKGRVYSEGCVRHVWCDRSHEWRVDTYPSVLNLVCYCILASK